MKTTSDKIIRGGVAGRWHRESSTVMARERPGARFRIGWTSALLTALLLIAGTGCQTFSLSEADFQKEQRGDMVDPQVGNAVSTVGETAYYGAMLGMLVAYLVKK